jgi:hypothetical protein
MQIMRHSTEWFPLHTLLRCSPASLLCVVLYSVVAHVHTNKQETKRQDVHITSHTLDRYRLV